MLVAGTAYVAVGVTPLELEEKFDDVPGEFFWLMESPGIFVEGLLNREDIVVLDVEGEVAGFAVE